MLGFVPQPNLQLIIDIGIVKKCHFEIVYSIIKKEIAHGFIRICTDQICEFVLSVPIRVLFFNDYISDNYVGSRSSTQPTTHRSFPKYHVLSQMLLIAFSSFDLNHFH